MKTLLTTTLVATAVIVAGWTGLARSQEREQPAEGAGMPMMEMMARCRMTMRAELSPRDPAVLLGMREKLDLTDQQVDQLQTLAQETRRTAAGLLTDAQRQQVEQLPQQPQSMMRMHQQMMGRMKNMDGDMGHMQGMKGMDGMCGMMMGGMGRHGDGMMPRMHMEQGNAPANQPRGQAKLNARMQGALDQVVESYLAIQQRLAQDEMQGVQAQLTELHSAAHALGRAESPEVRNAAEAVAETAHDARPENLDEAREVFTSLSAGVIALTELAAPSDEAASALYVASCPMAEASWLQSSKQVVNPYMGQRMPRCGSIKQTIKRGDAEEESSSAGE